MWQLSSYARSQSPSLWSFSLSGAGDLYPTTPVHHLYTPLRGVVRKLRQVAQTGDVFQIWGVSGEQEGRQLWTLYLVLERCLKVCQPFSICYPCEGIIANNGGNCRSVPHISLDEFYSAPLECFNGFPHIKLLLQYFSGTEVSRLTWPYQNLIWFFFNHSVVELIVCLLHDPLSVEVQFTGRCHIFQLKVTKIITIVCSNHDGCHLWPPPHFTGGKRFLCDECFFFSSSSSFLIISHLLICLTELSSQDWPSITLVWC